MQENYRKTPLILIVDDMPMNLRMLESILTKAGYKITSAESAAEAFEIMEHILPDLILSDVVMPEMDGFELCSRLKDSEATREIPLIFLTAKTGTGEIVKGFRSGGVDYLTKPFNATELLARVQTHLELKRSKMELKEKSEKLKEMDRAKSRFFANISHEFRTPLTLIMGPLEQLLSEAPEKAAKDNVRLMLRNSQRLLNLINQLLELAKFESGKIQLRASPQNIVPFVKSIVMCFESLVVQNKVNLVFLKTEDHMTVYFDPEKLEKIVSNLLSNAFKYTPAHGEITVSLKSFPPGDRFPSGGVEISVRDTGSGIPPDRLPHIFDRFFTEEGRARQRQKGVGIGLALAKELAEIHHGEIDVRNHPAEDADPGTEFTVRLPMGDRHLQPGEIAKIEEPFKPTTDPAAYTDEDEADDGVEKEDPGKSRKKEVPMVLLVDDSPEVCNYIKSTLEPRFRVVEAADGREGIRRAREFVPDIIVSDVTMPNADGYELCRTLKNDILTSHIPIILLTAGGSGASELEGLETGADDYITKPVNTAVLTARLRNLLDLRRQLQLERKNRMTLQPREIPVSPVDDEFYKKLQETVETHLPDPDFNAEALGRVLGMSQATLYRKIHGLTGKTPLVFIRTYRLKRAAQLLGTREVNVSQVAGKVGFADRSHFTKCFKEQFNRLPSAFLHPNPAARGTSLHGPGDRVSSSGIPNPGLYNRESQHGADVVTEPAEPVPPHKSTRSEKETILVVEDNDDARSYIRGSLEPGYRVVETADGSEGIARAMEVLPDLIVSDIMMPDTDGFELCRVVKKDVRTSHIPIILLTARASDESKIRGLETGADDYITKPFSTAILRARIKNLIQLRNHLHKKRNREMELLPATISGTKIDKDFMKELKGVIKKNLSEPEFNVEQLAKKLYMSSATLYRKILALTGETPSEYIRSHRLRRAARLLKNNYGSVTEVAFEVGFTSRTYFTQCFKEKFHQLPSVYMAAKSS